MTVATSGLVFDARQALPGRGAYVCPSEACATKASRQLAKALRSPGLNVAAGWLWSAVQGRAPALPDFEASPPDDEPVG